MSGLRTSTLVIAMLAVGCSTRLGNLRNGLQNPFQSSPSTYLPGSGTQPGNVTSTPKLAGGSLQLTPDNTRITFVGSALATSHEGRFAILSGRWDLPTSDPKDCRLEVTVNVDSLETRIRLMTNHLKSAGFFDTARYPTATFVSRSIIANPNSSSTHIITGDFTIHGTTRTLSIPARFTVTAAIAGFDSTFTIRQSDFGMDSARTTTDEVPVTVSVRIPLPQQSAEIPAVPF